MPPRWFIRNTSTSPLTGRRPPSGGYQTSVGHVTEMVGHASEFGGHDAETVGHALPKYALVGDFNFRPDDPDRARLLAPMDPGTPAYCDAWEVAHPGHPHEPTVGLHDKQQWPGPPFTCDFVCVSADIASRVRDVRVDGATDASDHQPMLLELA